MCLLERKTAKRGRAAVPRTFFRTRRWRRSRASTLWSVIAWGPSRSGASLRRLAGLAQDALVGVSDPLALVGLGLAELADVGGHLADELLVGTQHHDARGLGHVEGDAVGGVDVHGVGEAELELDLRRALRDGAVADADDLEVAGE